ncbi:NLR family CARD domain-containing protein 3-like [Notolabrus celidotus]|uniref:NLR family CARD domain-containing protein 3-like n=1 Tax=Notolabrus celidotus TaxID=1203425 RepID=UPI00148FB9F7|nr:NLR family CARD domain-containing protein 3-like [Notolabrus celidotus]
MNGSEETEDRVSPPNLSKPNSPTKAHSSVWQKRPDLPGFTCVSMKSDHFKDGHSDKQIPGTPEGLDSPGPTCVSLRSDWSKDEPIFFKVGQKNQVIQERADPPGLSCVSMRSEWSKSEGEAETVPPRVSLSGPFRKRSEVTRVRPALNHLDNLDSIFTLLEENMVAFLRTELKKFRRVLDPENLEKLREDDDIIAGEEEEQESSNREALMKITLNFMRRIKQEKLADSLKSKTLAMICQRNLKSKLKRNFKYLFEGIAKAGNPTLLNHIYTELYITEGESREVNDQHEVRQIEAVSQRAASSETTIRCEDLFGPLPHRAESIRTLLTKGMAGIGKTVLTQKYILDWAEDKANKNIQFIFPFTFRELNLLQKRKFSLVELLHHVFVETKEAGICRLNEFNVVFVLDGLDECQLPLDFHKNEILTDVTEPTSVEVLLTNLIRGKLLPSAHIWITTRPAAANQIPPECIDMVTEVRGFSDPQKEEYFRKKFRDPDQASRIISHIKTSRNLHMMCYIPVFCWITAAVLEDLLKIRESEHLPNTLTEVYIHYLVVQTKQGSVKYYSNAAADSVWDTDMKKTILSLGKLAFEQLEKGNLIFYEADLQECGIDIKVASVYSGLFMEILKEGHGLNQARMFCFVHLSIQEFLAALFVILTFTNHGVDPLRAKQLPSVHPVPLLHKSYFQHLKRAVDKSVESPNGHLDLFVRFLLGLSLETNQMQLRGLLKKTRGSPQAKDMVALHIKKKIQETASPERSINLLHCLNELNDHSLVEEMQQYLRSGSVARKNLSPSQCSALGFIILTSQKGLDQFDLRKFSASEEGLLRLLPVVKASKTSVLSGCNLSNQSCVALGSVFSINSSLRQLDLSNNDLRDTGVELLSNGLKSPHCQLEILGLSGCLVTETGCASLAAALNINPSHLKELDLSFNHPGDLGVMLISVGMNNKKWKLETLKMDHCGKGRLKPSPRRYFCELSLDPFTANKNLLLSEDLKGAMLVKEKQLYFDQPERFDTWKQLLCDEGLTGLGYWEVQWDGRVNIGVTYSGINRRGDGNDCCIGWNDKSWSLICTPQGYTAWHNNTSTDIDTHLTPQSNRVAVYLDWPAGAVSFYCLQPTVSSVKPIHLHTFHSTFTEPLYPAFGFGQILDSKFKPASAYLIQIDE